VNGEGELNGAPSSSRVQGAGASEDETEQVSGVRERVHGGALPVGLESMERAELVLLRRERGLWERERELWLRERELTRDASVASAETSGRWRQGAATGVRREGQHLLKMAESVRAPTEHLSA